MISKSEILNVFLYIDFRLQKELQNLEDAGDELMLLEDDTAPIPYPWLFSVIRLLLCGHFTNQSSEDFLKGG